MRLKVWHRLGIVLSVAWVLGGGGWQATQMSRFAAEQGELTYSLCYSGPHPSSPEVVCELQAQRTRDAYRQGLWTDVAVRTFLPLALAWAAVFLAIWVTRWVLAGRERSVD
jgi:hypothetical protein